MGYKNTDPCIKNAFDDEKLFVLMTRDSTSPQVICEWIKLNLGNQPREKLIEALDCAIEMENNRHKVIKRINRPWKEVDNAKN